MIFDTNILIYLSKHTLSLEAILTEQAKISVITQIEALGFQFKNKYEHELLVDICAVLPIIPLSDLIAEATIKIRASNRIKLPDAIIYATALVEGLPLITHNIDDFTRLGGNVKLIDPFKL